MLGLLCHAIDRVNLSGSGKPRYRDGKTLTDDYERCRIIPNGRIYQEPGRQRRRRLPNYGRTG